MLTLLLSLCYAHPVILLLLLYYTVTLTLLLCSSRCVILTPLLSPVKVCCINNYMIDKKTHEFKSLARAERELKSEIDELLKDASDRVTKLCQSEKH